mmetsp:Transcript_27728/g.50533  ORF Transcript_27728/g.50533 Transcript_27728/m.50533 type:complete len:266 (-) Transcript_27728:804-1601(-)
MIKSTRSTKKKLDKARHSGSGSNQVPPDRSGHSSRGGGGGDGVDTNNNHLPHHHHRGQTGDRSISSAYSAHSQYSTHSDYTDGTSGQHAGYPNLPGGGGVTAGDGGRGNNAGGAGGNNHRTGRSAHGRRHQRGGANAGGASGPHATTVAMVNSILPNLKTIAASIIGSCVITSLLQKPGLPPPAVVDRPLTWLDKEAPNIWLRPSAVVDRSSTSTRLEKASPNDDTSAIYVYPWAGRNIRAHARLPEPSKETILFWHIPKVRYDN